MRRPTYPGRALVVLAAIGLVAGCGGGTSSTGPAAGSVPPTIAPTSPALAPMSPAALAGTVYYVRPDGGSPEQCTGLADAPYPGSGTSQPCAWDHPFRAFPPGDTARIAGGDALIVGSGSYEMGYGAPGAEACDYESSYDCLMSPVPSGPDAAHPTQILGAGWDSGCAGPPELWGSGRPWSVFNLSGSSNVQVACLEITDHSSCIEDHASAAGGSEYACRRDEPPYGDWAATGLYAEDSANVLLKDLDIHGLANTGVLAGRLADWTVENVRVAGNGWAGWDTDLVGDGSNSENHGTFHFRHWTVEWNGCGETYPDEEHLACWGQEAGGYGDGAGFGGTTGGSYVIEDSAFLHNTSDGLDMLYTRLPGVTIEIRRTIAAGNDGNQIKLTAERAVLENVVLVGDCGAFHGMPYWNNDDDCRAGGDALSLDIQPGGQVEVRNATITGQGNVLMNAGCALGKECTGEETVRVSNSLFQGQRAFQDDEDVAFAWYDDESSPPMPADPFVVVNSLITGVRFGNVTPCPGTGNLCGVASGLTDPSIEHFDPMPRPDSPAVDAALASEAPPDDITGQPRDSRPDIGACERRQGRRAMAPGWSRARRPCRARLVAPEPASSSPHQS